VNRKPTTDAFLATCSCKRTCAGFKVVIETDASARHFRATELARMWAKY
jgi:hypothetical protein